MANVMSVLGELNSRTFIERYWQKEPLLVRDAIDPVPARVDGDTLAGLACESLVDAQLVVTRTETQDWHCEHGPFEETRFLQLPTHDWTLLVQGVDQWIPEVSALLDRFDFLPRWRIDDVMVSFATQGGGVGPHFDYYDVFLLQLEGSRHWRIGQRCDAHSPLRDHPELNLLQDFESREDWLLEPGDMLYVPPGLAHWGTAVDGNCITASVGFRAPAHSEIFQGVADQILLRFEEHQRFVDSPASIDADPFRINEDALKAACSLLPDEAFIGMAEEVAIAFGRLVTEPRTPDLIEPETEIEAESLEAVLHQGESLELHHHPASRFAYLLNGEAAILFVDGEAFPTVPVVAEGICHGRLEPGQETDEGVLSLLSDLCQSGSLRCVPRS